MYIYIYIYIHIYIDTHTHTHIYIIYLPLLCIYVYIHNISATYGMLFMYICFPLCMFSGTNLLNIHRISGIKRIIGTKIGANNLESLFS